LDSTNQKISIWHSRYPFSKICVIGCGTLGKTILKGLSADRSLSVRGVDIYHPDNELNIHSNYDQALDSTELMFVCVNTPFRNDCLDMSNVLEVAGQLKALLPSDVSPTIVIRSTVIPGTTREFERIVRAKARKAVVYYMPTFLEERNAIYQFLHPRRMVIGYDHGSDPSSWGDTDRLATFWRVFLDRNCKSTTPHWYFTDSITAELTKLANNAARAAIISFYNQIALLCDRVSADPNIMAEIISHDPRINTDYGTATHAAYGGRCLPKDVRGLISFSKRIAAPNNLLLAVHEINELVRATHGTHSPVEIRGDVLIRRRHADRLPR
jgi:UDPglucose 6-dehydrogenase